MASKPLKAIENAHHVASGYRAALFLIAFIAILETLWTSYIVTYYIHDNAIAYNQHTQYYIMLGLSVLHPLLLFVIFIVLRPVLLYVTQTQESNHLKSNFLANMSHELRTPINGIFGMTELLLDSNLSQHQQHYARTLQNSADHLLGLLNDILDFSKLEAGQMKLDPIHFNLLSTIEDILELLSARAQEKNIELLLNYVPSTPTFVVADPGRIRQVMFNLIGNAIKFTDNGYVMTHVEIIKTDTEDRKKTWLRVRVEDTGIGIPEDKINSLFEKFMQVESSSTRARQGTGLGLAISRSLIELMGGDIRVRSMPGEGTVFSWQIPLPETTIVRVPLQRDAVLSGKRILLVDDLAPNRLLFRNTFDAVEVECLVAENAEEALSILACEYDNNRPLHAIITDYMMPITDGAQLTQRIKFNEYAKNIPVIILSSAGERGLIKKFDEAGASACLAKPVSRQQLLDTLAHVLHDAEHGKKTGIITGEASAAISARKLLVHEKALLGTTVLLVEDNKVNLEITSEIVSQLGCVVIMAENGEEAIEKARCNQFDIILMDCQMPVMDGFEAARHIVTLKALGQIAPVPIIALTANALKDDRERCLESGMDDYLSKPVRKTNLEAIMIKWLREKLELHVQSNPQHHTQATITEALVKPYLMAPDSKSVDLSVFADMRGILGNKFTTILAYFLEDAKNYIGQMEHAVQKNDLHKLFIAAHTLKSSSCQFGAYELARLAEEIELGARGQPPQATCGQLETLIPPLRDALARVTPFFSATIDEYRDTSNADAA